MKRFALYMTASALLFAGACEKVEDVTPAASEATTDARLTVLTDAAINGTTISSESTVAGLISDATTGKGIAGVPVSDGYTFTVTDANGVYQMQRNSLTRKVYYTTPASYKVSMDDATHNPAFYSPGFMSKDVRYRVDFKLEPLEAAEDNFTLVMVGDPQCYQYSEVVRYNDETMADIKSYVGEKGKQNVYAMTLGDIVFDNSYIWEEMKATMSNIQIGGKYVPFFQVIGNHDHDSLVSDGTDLSDNDYRAVAKYVEYFGPTDYSFNRGKAHIVVMDDVLASDITSSGKPNRKTWNYFGGFTASQYEWLKQDLALVTDKENTLLIFCTHIPFRGGSNEYDSDGVANGASVNRTRYYNEFLDLMTDFKEAHIMIGHTHYPQNYIHTGKVCAGGQPIYEHVHQAACGAWWAADCSVSGAPNGYNVYDIQGTTVQDWVNKGTNKPEDYQLRVYDGTQIYTGTKKYSLNWYTASQKAGTITIKGAAAYKNCVVVEAWDDDDANCTVEFWQNGEKVGNFTKVGNGTSANVAVCSYWFNEQAKSTSTWASTAACHYWYYKPASGNPSEETGWEVRFTRRIPSSGVEHVYTRSDLTTDYSEFDYSLKQ